MKHLYYILDVKFVVVSVLSTTGGTSVSSEADRLGDWRFFFALLFSMGSYETFRQIVEEWINGRKRRVLLS